MTQRHVPQQTDEMWRPFAGKADRLTFDTAMLQLARANFVAIAQAIANAPDGGVLIHCEVGKDRTGLMTMLLLDLVGTPAEVIAADYGLTATGLALLFADLIANRERRASHASPGGVSVPSRGHGRHPFGVPRKARRCRDVSAARRLATGSDRCDPRADAGWTLPQMIAVTVPAEAISGGMAIETFFGMLLGTTITVAAASWFWRLGLRNYTGASA